MTSLELDPRFTFDTFIVGAGNRLAAGAARRVAESPGASYNPLFLYSASGLGKTHLVMALGHYARRIHPDKRAVYNTLERFMDEVMTAIEGGDRDAYRNSVSDVSMLLLDDVQFLAGRHRTQEELIRAWDTLSARGGQIVLASDRPPPEIDGLDDRLLSRFSGGLIVDIAAPDYETRVAIVRRKSEERGQQLAPGVAESLARTAFANVRELQGSLNRLLAVQELEGRTVEADEVQKVVGAASERTPAPAADEFGKFLSDISGTVARAVAQTPAEHHLGEAIMRFESEGYRTRRLEVALSAGKTDEQAEVTIRQFEADVERMREITGEILSLEPGAPEAARQEVLRDPERISDAEELLAEVRERNRPLPSPPTGYTFGALALAPDLLAMRAAAAVAADPGTRYNPLYIFGPEDAGKSALLAALGNELQIRRPELAIAFVQGSAFAAELIRAVDKNRADSWRARYRRAQVLMLDNVDALIGTERAQEELFHLFDTLQRAGAQLIFASCIPPRDLAGIEDRLRTRLESGLVVELPSPSDAAVSQEAAGKSAISGGVAANGAPPVEAAAPARGKASKAITESAAPVRADMVEELDEWFQNKEKLLWDWPNAEEWIVEGLE
jgi:chromosomal replication initiator protein